jgi:hypothetical protein
MAGSFHLSRRSVAGALLFVAFAVLLIRCTSPRSELGPTPEVQAEKLQREQRPGDRLEMERVRSHERVARANRLDDREQPFENHVVQRDAGQAEKGDRAHAHDQPLRVRRRRKLERAHDPLMVGHDQQQSQDRGSPKPVQDDEDPQHDVCDRQRGGRDGPGHVHHLALSTSNTYVIDYHNVPYCNSIMRSQRWLRACWWIAPVGRDQGLVGRPHSSRSATMGSTRLARRAGT